jgi:hypothetical protein
MSISICPKFKYCKTIKIIENSQVYKKEIYKAVNDNIYQIVNRKIHHIYNSTSLQSIEYMSENKFKSLYMKH